MSEYAIRKSDGKDIYIGSCENMSCLRYEDRTKVIPSNTSFNIESCQNLYWRLPVPDEDNILPGDYTGCSYYRKDVKSSFLYIHHSCRLNNDPKEFEGIIDAPGSFQLVQEALGLILSVRCYHGFKLNRNNDETVFGWNGKSDALCLMGVKNEEKEMKILYRCVSCNKKWSCSYQEIQHLITNQEMNKRLFKLCSEYWELRNPGKEYPHGMSRRTKGGTVSATVVLKRWNNAFGDKYLVGIDTQDDGQTDYFKTLEDAFNCYIRY